MGEAVSAKGSSLSRFVDNQLKDGHSLGGQL